MRTDVDRWCETNECGSANDKDRCCLECGAPESRTITIPNSETIKPAECKTEDDDEGDTKMVRIYGGDRLDAYSNVVGGSVVAGETIYAGGRTVTGDQYREVSGQYARTLVDIDAHICAKDDH